MVTGNSEKSKKAGRSYSDYQLKQYQYVPQQLGCKKSVF